jgi:hypothetical protein
MRDFLSWTVYRRLVDAFRVVNIMRVNTIFTGVAGAPYLSTHYFFGAAEPDVAMANAAITAVKNFWFQLGGVMNNTTAWAVQGGVQVIRPSDGQLQGILAGTQQTGAGTVSGGNQLPYAAQGLISWATGEFVDGRHVQGRTFLGGLTVQAGTGVPITQLYTSSGTAITAIVTTPTTAKLCVYQRERNPDSKPGQLPHRAGTYHQVTGGTLRPYFAVLRSRRT